ncbi:MAG TPA: hypothetical protein VGM19_09855 [Armatimonadota bacterium]
MALAGDASREATESLNGHVAQCADCERQWRSLRGLAESLAGRDAGMVVTHDLTASALDRAQVSRPAGFTVPRRRAKLVAVGVAVVLLTAVTLGLYPFRLDSAKLLALAEAASEARVTHGIISIYDREGKLVQRQEYWVSANGRVYSETQAGGNTVEGHLSPSEHDNVLWVWHKTEDEYELVWNAVDLPFRMRDKMRERFAQGLAQVKLPAGTPESLREWIGAYQMNGWSLTAKETRGELEGKPTRVILITATKPPSAREPSASSETNRCYLTDDGSRLLRMVTTYFNDGVSVATQDRWPIEYDTHPPDSLFTMKMPADAKVVFRGERIDPVWETMTEREKGEIRGVIDGLAKAWKAGDYPAFSQYFDPGPSVQYGKSRWTAAELREIWAKEVAGHPGRWQDDQIIFDYAFGTANPPKWALHYWSIYELRTKSPDGSTQVAYRSGPPGITVLARERVTDKQGKVQELGTFFFLRKLGGQYKVIAWAPPFG